jgi:hypothetical protein
MQYSITTVSLDIEKWLKLNFIFLLFLFDLSAFYKCVEVIDNGYEGVKWTINSSYM